MEHIPNITEILTWPQAVFAIVVVIAVLVVPQIVQLIQNTQIKKQLQPNHGSSARDALDRIEKKLDTHIKESATSKAAVLDRLHKLDGN